MCSDAPTHSLSRKCFAVAAAAAAADAAAVADVLVAAVAVAVAHMDRLVSPRVFLLSPDPLASHHLTAVLSVGSVVGVVLT